MKRQNEGSEIHDSWQSGPGGSPVSGRDGGGANRNAGCDGFVAFTSKVIWWSTVKKS